MTQEYTPDTEKVKQAYSGLHEKNYYDFDAMQREENFDRWLAEHDKRIRREALTLTDEEAGLVAKKMDSLNLPEETEQYGEFQSLDARTLFDELSKSRERES